MGVRDRPPMKKKFPTVSISRSVRVIIHQTKEHKLETKQLSTPRTVDPVKDLLFYETHWLPILAYCSYRHW